MVCLGLEAGEESGKTIFGNGFPGWLRSHLEVRIKRKTYPREQVGYIFREPIT